MTDKPLNLSTPRRIFNGIAATLRAHPFSALLIFAGGLICGLALGAIL